MDTRPLDLPLRGKTARMRLIPTMLPPTQRAALRKRNGTLSGFEPPLETSIAFNNDQDDARASDSAPTAVAIVTPLDGHAGAISR